MRKTNRTDAEIRAEAMKHYDAMHTYAHTRTERARAAGDRRQAVKLLNFVFKQTPEIACSLSDVFSRKRDQVRALRILPFFWGSLQAIELEFSIPRAGRPDRVSLQELAPLLRNEVQAMDIGGQAITLSDVYLLFRRRPETEAKAPVGSSPQAQ